VLVRQVCVDTEQEENEWMSAINDAIRKTANRHEVVIAGQRFELDRRYTSKGKIGVGAYGIVVAGEDAQTGGTKVAIKKINNAFHDLTDAKRILREIRFMRLFNHPNLLRLHDILPPSSLAHFSDLYIISERISTDLQKVIALGSALSEDQQQFIVYQCLCALQYMHRCGVIHRDLKPSNILINTETCDVTICDFGLSRGDIETTEHTEYVVTRWYRAPEIMLGFRRYGFAIDVWSLGCVFGELLRREALLQGRDYIDQLKRIVNLV